MILYAIYPVTGRKFLKWKYGKAEPPAEVKAKTLEESLKHKALRAKVWSNKVMEIPDKKIPEKGEASEPSTCLLRTISLKSALKRSAALP